MNPTSSSDQHARSNAVSTDVERTNHQASAHRHPESLVTGTFSRFVEIGGLMGKIGASVIGNSTAGLFRAATRQQDKALQMWMKNGHRIVDTLGRMKGAAMKVGQMLSLHDGLLPPEVAQILSTLQKEAPPVPFSELQATLEQDFPDYRHRFSDIETEALASASIGQVHRARLRDGRDVVIKVQYPGIDRVIRSDLSNLKTMFRMIGSTLFKIDMNIIWSEIQERLLEEIDYRNELRNQTRFQQLFADDDGITIPRLYSEHCGAHVLTSEYVPGRTLTDITGETDAQRNAWGRNLMRIYLKQIFQHRLLHADPNAGNYAFLPDGKIAFYDFGNVKQIPDFLIPGYRRLIAAALRNDADRIPEILKTMRIHHLDGRPVRTEIISGYLEIFAPVFRGEYCFGSDESIVRKVMDLGRSYWFDAFDITFPPDIIFIDRTVGGLLGNLSRIKACADWSELMRVHGDPQAY